MYDIVVNERASTTARFRECEHGPMLGRKKLGDPIWSEVHNFSPLLITKQPEQISLKEDPVGMYPELRMNRPGHKICSFFHIPHRSSYSISIPFPSSKSGGRPESTHYPVSYRFAIPCSSGQSFFLESLEGTCLENSLRGKHWFGSWTELGIVVFRYLTVLCSSVNWRCHQCFHCLEY